MRWCAYERKRVTINAHHRPATERKLCGDTRDGALTSVSESLLMRTIDLLQRMSHL